MEIIAKVTLFLFASLAISAAMPTKKLQMPASCANSDFCTEKHDLYPEEVVNRVLKNSNITFTDGKPTPVHRIDEGYEERDCEVNMTDDPIYEIVDSDGNVRVVLQSEQGFRQKVTIERCLKPGHIDYKTMHFDLDMVKQFNLFCEEQKMDLGFLVLSLDWEGLEMVKPKTGIPVRCDCKMHM